MADFKFTVFTQAQLGVINDEPSGTVTGTAKTATVTDNDLVLDDQASDSGQTFDSSSQVLAAALEGQPAGRVVQSTARFNVTNQTTGETGFAYRIRVYNTNDPLAAAVGNDVIYRAFTIAVSPGDVLVYSAFNFIGQAVYASLFLANAQVAPVANDDSAIYNEDGAAVIAGNVLANDTDANTTDVLTIQNPGTFKGQFGTLILNADGSYSYAGNDDLIDTLAADATDTFSYTVSDGKGGLDTATLTITVDLADDNRTINGTSRDDVLTGDVDRPGTEDTIRGGTGNDRISGLDGADTLFGGSGNDTILGGDGRDTLYGESGTDTLDGGAGDDLIDGGSGKDRLTGGSGADRFAFTVGNGDDVITDFRVGTDRLVLDNLTIRTIVSRDVDGDRDMDLVVTLSSGGGTITLLDVASGTTAEQLQGTERPPTAAAQALHDMPAISSEMLML